MISLLTFQRKDATMSSVSENRFGEMSERFKEPVLKTGDVQAPWVRIPLSPPL